MTKRDDFYAIRHQAFRAIRRGDLDTAIRWTMMMRYQLRMVRQIGDLENHRPRPKPKPPKPAPAQPLAAKGPVMLDPKGFSPGGEPNWVLNQRRLERAGLKEWPPGTKRFT